MVDFLKIEFESLTDKIVKLEESFINSYVNKCLKTESTINSTRIIRRILYPKYEKDDLKKVTTGQCKHLTPSKRENSLKLKNILIFVRWNSWHVEYHPV